jgi:hypothetical protein
VSRHTRVQVWQNIRGTWSVSFEGLALREFSAREDAMTFANRCASDIYTARLLKELRGES